MTTKNGLEIVACMYDVNTIEYAVKDTATGRYIAECCRDMKEAAKERDAYLKEMHSFSDGPYSTSQSRL